MAKRSHKAWPLLFTCLGLSSCGEEGPADMRWEITFTCASDAARTTAMQLRVYADLCQGEKVVYETNLLRDKQAPSDVLSPGSYYFEAVATDENGAVLAGDCQSFELPRQMVELSLTSLACVLSMPMDGGPAKPEEDAGTWFPEEPDGGTTEPSNDGGVSCTGDDCPGACALPKGNCSCKQFEGHTYLFCSEPLDWAGARARCRAQGADLVVIESAPENAFLRSAGGANRWLGANDRGFNGSPLGSCPGQCNKTGDEGTWKWVNGPGDSERGAPLCEVSEKSRECHGSAYSNWAGQEPDNATDMGIPCIPYVSCAVGEDCALMAADGTWRDVSCDLERPFICESY